MSAPSGTKPPPLPKKPVDRRRPFLRLEPRAAAKAPDGIGADCGCFTPKEFGDLDQATIDLLTQNVAGMGTLRDALETARTIAKAVATGLEVAMIATAIGLGLGPLIGVGLAGLALIREIIKTVDDVLEIVEKKIIGRFVKRILPRACRSMPSWVPVKKGASNIKTDDDQIVEVQGIVTRSYQNPLDVPFFQWHHWYNWTIHVKPDAGFENVLSPALNPATTARSETGERPVQEGGTIELMWDAGALFRNRAPYENGFPSNTAAQHTGPMAQADWAWPMPGQFVWAAGRWVYDCSRATTDDRNGRMQTLLNPLKAIATARLEGFKFAENERAVPATQFMFFTCKRGGYIDHDRINDRDYEFIVDLPEGPEEDLEPLAVGRTEKEGLDFDHNTIVIRPRLLMHVNTGAFGAAGGKSIDPVVTPIPPEKGSVPKQVRVKVPATSLGVGDDAYGFVLSLGWFDATGEEAEKVRECTVALKKIEGTDNRTKRDKPDEISKLVKEAEEEIVADAKKKVRERIVAVLGEDFGGVVASVAGALIDFFVTEIVDAFLSAFTSALESALSSDEEWLVHVGVNGRWLPFRFDFDGDAVALNRNVKFLLLRDTEAVVLSFSSVDIDPVGEIMFEPHRQRIIDSDGTEVAWDLICDPPGSAAQKLAIRKKLVLRYVFKLLTTLGDDNDPLGIVEQRHFRLGDQLHDGFFMTAFFTRALDDQRTVVTSVNAPLAEFALHYSVDIKKLPEPG